MLRVLIVEDELMTRQGIIVTTPWHDYDMEVIGEAFNGKEGLELAKKLNPDIIITDVRMPEMDGIEMIETIVEHQECVVIIMSAFSEFEYAQRAIQCGAVDYLLKPFSDDALTQALHSAATQVKRLDTLKNTEMVTRETLADTASRYLSKSDRSQHKNIQQAIEYVKQHYASDVSLSSVSHHLDVSESYLSRLFRAETSYSFHEYLTVYRMKVACELLIEPHIKIYEVANAVGYKDQRYFSIVFKKYFGMSPNHFKEQY